MTKLRSEMSAKTASDAFSPAQFSELGKQQLDALLAMQKEFFEAAQEMNRAWSARTESEAAIVSQFLGKLAAARSLPDAMSAYQECMGKQIELLTQEGRRFYEDSTKLMTKSARLFPNGGHTAG
jgi:Phasin protein